MEFYWVLLTLSNPWDFLFNLDEEENGEGNLASLEILSENLSQPGDVLDAPVFKREDRAQVS